MLSHLSAARKAHYEKLIYIFNITAVMLRKHQDHKTLFNTAKIYFYHKEKGRVNLVTHSFIL